MSLAPKEVAEMERAKTFISIFDGLLEVARRSPSGAELMTLNQQAAHYTEELRNFKLHLLSRHLTSEVAIHLPPTFLNHMLNELDEYGRVLKALLAGNAPPVFHAIH